MIICISTSYILLYPYSISYNKCWLVVSTPLKNISQMGLLFPIYGKIKNVPNHQPVIVCSSMGKHSSTFLKFSKIEHLIVNMDWLCQLGLFCS